MVNTPLTNSQPSATDQCPECGAALPPGETCQSNFHALLYRENEIGQQVADAFTTEQGHIAHFYAVSCYAIQHPVSMGYTVDALRSVRDNLARHLRGEVTIAMVRQQVRANTNGPGRVQRRAGDPVHDWHVQQWPYTITDVLATPPTLQAYVAATHTWASATIETLARIETLDKHHRPGRTMPH